jgi:hypothetical protein
MLSTVAVMITDVPGLALAAEDESEIVVVGWVGGGVRLVIVTTRGVEDKPDELADMDTESA